MNDEGIWVTIRGRHVFIKKGQTLSDAIKEYDAKNKKQSKEDRLTSLTRTLTNAENKALIDKSFLKGDALIEELKKTKEQSQKRYSELKETDSDFIKNMWKEEAEIDIDKIAEIASLNEEVRNERKAKVAEYQGKLSEINGTVSYQKENGEIVQMLSTKDYKKMATDFANTLSDSEKDIICNYVATPSYAYSAELNAVTKEKLENEFKGSGSLSRYALNLDKENICTERERDEKRVKAYKNYKERCEALGVNRLSYEDEKRWREENNMGSNISPYFLSDTKIYTDDEIKAAKEIAPKLKEIEDKKARAAEDFGYSSEEYKKLEEEHTKLQEGIDPKLRENRTSWAAYYYQQIANKDTNLVFKDGIGGDTISKDAESGIVYMNTKQMLDMKLTDEQLAIQPTSVQNSYKGIHSATKEFDNLFKEKGVELKEDILVFRRGRETSKEIEEGFTMNGYVSTSAFDTLPKKMPSGNHFGEASYYLLIPKGSKVLFAEKVIGYKDKTEEEFKVSRGVQRQHEIILPRNTSFSKVTYDVSRNAYILLTEQHLFGEGGNENE